MGNKLDKINKEYKNKLDKINKEYKKELEDLSFIERIFVSKSLIYAIIYNKIMKEKD